MFYEEVYSVLKAKNPKEDLKLRACERKSSCKILSITTTLLRLVKDHTKNIAAAQMTLLLYKVNCIRESKCVRTRTRLKLPNTSVQVTDKNNKMV